MQEVFMAVEFQSFSSSGVCESRRQLHTPSAFARSTLFYVQEAGTLQSIQSHLCSRKGLDSFLFILVLSGRGQITHQDRSYTLSGGDCALIDCHRPYSHLSSENEPWELMWIHFNGPAARSYYSCFIKNIPSGIFHAQESSLFSTPLLQLLDAAADTDQTSEFLCSKLITDVLTLCFTVPRQNEAAPFDRLAGKIQAVKDYIDSHFQNRLSLDDLSRQFFVSKFHLAREFKRAYGMTLGNYILAQRITYAKELLRFSNKSIEAIAAACGVTDTSYFNKVFKKSEGTSPSLYRRHWAHRP